MRWLSNCIRALPFQCPRVGRFTVNRSTIFVWLTLSHASGRNLPVVSSEARMQSLKAVRNDVLPSASATQKVSDPMLELSCWRRESERVKSSNAFERKIARIKRRRGFAI